MNSELFGKSATTYMRLHVTDQSSVIFHISTNEQYENTFYSSLQTLFYLHETDDVNNMMFQQI
jgi:hypothetical protein